MTVWTETSSGQAATSGVGVGGNVGATVASAASITLTEFVTEISGSTAISTINGLTSGRIYVLIPAAGSSWSLTTGGNIAQAAVPVIGEPLFIVMHGATVRVITPDVSGKFGSGKTETLGTATVDSRFASPAVLHVADGTAAVPSTNANPMVTLSRITDARYPGGDSSGVGSVLTIQGTKLGAANSGGFEVVSIMGRKVGLFETGQGIVTLYARVVSDYNGNNTDFGIASTAQKFTTLGNTGAGEFNTNNLSGRDASPFYNGDNINYVLSLIGEGANRNTVGLYIDGVTSPFFNGLDFGTLCTGTGAFVSTITVTAGGSGYTSGANVAITGGGFGVAPTAVATVAGGIVTEIRIVSAGTGGDGTTPAVAITPVGAGSGATATATVDFYAAIRVRATGAPLYFPNNKAILVRNFADNGVVEILKLDTNNRAVMPGTDVKGWFSTHRNVIALVNGDNNDVALGDSSFVKTTGPTGAFAVTGFAGGADGRILRLYNSSAQTMTIKNANAGSIAANRILTLTGADVVLRVSSVSFASFIYDVGSSVWVLMSTN